MALILRPPGHQVRTAVSDGLKYWWPLDDGCKTFAREVIQGAHGTGNSGKTGLMWGRQPITGSQIRGPLMTSASSNGYNCPTLTLPCPKFAICAWVKAPSAGTGGYGLVFGQFGNGGTTRLQLFIKSSGFWVWYTGNSFSDPSPNGPADSTADAESHVIWQYDGTNFQIFNNGSIVQNVAGTSNAAPFSATGVNIGTSGTNSITGMIRDVRVYNRPMRSIGEAVQIYSEGIYTPPQDVEAIALMRPGGGGGGGGGSAIFRKTFSQIGGRIASRQPIGWGN